MKPRVTYMTIFSSQPVTAVNFLFPLYLPLSLSLSLFLSLSLSFPFLSYPTYLRIVSYPSPLPGLLICNNDNNN
ncbi:hypothetical protein F5X96DRAFT_644097, partial [Biscogniauxia mediterranea]